MAWLISDPHSRRQTDDAKKQQLSSSLVWMDDGVDLSLTETYNEIQDEQKSAPVWSLPKTLKWLSQKRIS